MVDSDDENFVTFGSALEPLDEDNLPRKKAVTIEDQYALDAQGRRRFHGAFTGGFSAGYFNSVGTRDGWRPQQFKSSRSSKAGGFSQSAADFMDEEDTGEFGIAPTAIRANSDFTDHGRRGEKRERPRRDNDGPIPGIPVLKELLKPVKETVGVSLLKKMGWRPGQGIGPRVTKQEKTKTRKNNEKLRIYGCSLPNEGETIEDSGSEDEGILFAPDDYEPFRCNPKDNYFGIGYVGLDRRPVLSGHVNLFEAPAFELQDKSKKLSIRGQAFGVGAFEADDEDIYQRDDMSRYDFSLGSSEPKSKSRWSHKKDAGASSDNFLEGFTPAKNLLQRKKIFPAPELPKDFKAFHAVRKSRFHPPIEPPVLSEGRKKGLARRDLTAVDRAVIIGDPVPSISTDVAKNSCAVASGSQVAHNIISRTLNLHGKEQTEERRQQEVQRSNSGPSWLDKLSSNSFVLGGIEGNDFNVTGSLQNFQDFKSNISTAVGVDFLRPFPTDQEKQKRFEKFVELARHNEGDKLESLQPLSMTEWERQREREEFDQAARLYEKSSAAKEKSDILAKQSSSGMSMNKFVAIGAEEASPSVAKTQDEQMTNAAKMKLFGKLTREREIWQPASLLCKRFNIPEPRTGYSKAEKPQKNKKYSVFDSLEFGGSSERFECATDTSETFREPHIPYKPKEKLANDGRDPMGVFDALDISASSSKSIEKIRSFEASYEKVFMRGTSTKTDDDPQREIVDDSIGSTDLEVDHSSAGHSSVNDDKDKKDLFKAIFLSSSEESDNENDEDEDDSEAVKSLLIGKAPGELNVQRNTSPPRGIFAQLDLDSLTKPGKAEDRLKARKEMGEDKREKIKEIVVEDENTCRVSGEPEVQLLRDMYGPVLPSKTPKNAEIPGNEETKEPQKCFFKSVVTRAEPTGNEDKVKGKWVERERVKKKSKKEKHKHKHKEKERSKHKHKKKDKR